MKRFKRSILIPSSLAFSIVAMPSQAQQHSTNEDTHLQPSNRNDVVDEIKITGHRFPTRPENVAGSVSLITQKDIAATQARNLADIFANLPGVDVESDPRYGIRSINIRGLSGNYVKVKVDNVDQPSEFNGGSFVSSSRIDFDVDMIKRIEVLKGPASSTQGSEAIGGSVLFSTIDPSDLLTTQKNDTKAWIKSDWHSLDKGQSYSMAVANRYNNLESLLAYSKRISEETESFGTVSEQDIKRDNVLSKLIYHLSDYQTMQLTGEFSKNISDGIPIDQGRYDDFYFTKDESQRTRLGIVHHWNVDNLVFDTSSLQFDWQNKTQDSNTYRKAMSGNAEKKDYAYEENNLQLELQLTKHFSTNNGDTQHNLAYGFNFKQADHENKNITWYDDNNDGIINDRSRQYFYIPSADVETKGAYIQDEIVIANGRLRITPGIRYDQFDIDPHALELDLGDELIGYSNSNSYTSYQDSEITGRLGIVFSLDESKRIFAQYSQGFKAPDFRQLYYSWSNDLHGYKSEPNPELRSETSDSIEIGFRQTSENITWEFAAFSSEYKDFIEQVSEFGDPSFPNGITRFENIREARIKGFEFSSHLSLAVLGAPEGTIAQFSMSYSDGENGSGEALESINPWSANLQLDYTSPNTLWGTSLRFNYAASVEHKNVIQAETQYLPDSYLSIDANIFWNLTEALILRAGINNLTNQQFERWSHVRGLSKDDFSDRYSQPGRNWALTAKYKF